MRQIKLLLACRDEDLALSLVAKIVLAGNGRIVGEAANLPGLRSKVAETRPDVLVLEHIHGEEKSAWQYISQFGPPGGGSTRVLLLCDAYTPLMIAGFIQRGASGCLLKSSEPTLCARAVGAVHAGESWFERAALVQALRGHFVAEPAASSSWLASQARLTARETEILGLIGSALSNKEIAQQLRISDKTVKTHLHHIYVKLHRSGRYKAFLSNAPAGLALALGEYRRIRPGTANAAGLSGARPG